MLHSISRFCRNRCSAFRAAYGTTTAKTVFNNSKSTSAQTSGGASGSQKWGSGSKWQNTKHAQLQRKIRRHRLSVMAGTELIFFESLFALCQKLAIPPTRTFGIYDLELANLSKPTNTWEEVGLASLLRRISYQISRAPPFFYVQPACRRWSSKFARQNRWGIFPSASAAWHQRRKFMQGSKSWLDNLKLRISYGSDG